MTFAPPVFPEQFNMARYFLDERVEEGRGDATAVIDDRGSYSYRDVQALATAGTKDQRNPRRGDRGSGRCN